MDAKYLNQLLIMKFPNLQESYEEEVSWQEGDSTGSHIVYGDVLTPYLMECVEKNYTEEVKKIFNFLEEILLLKNKYSDEVIAFSVLEGIFHLLNENSLLQKLLGGKTRGVFEELVQNFNRSS